MLGSNLIGQELDEPSLPLLCSTITFAVFPLSGKYLLLNALSNIIVYRDIASTGGFLKLNSGYRQS